MATAKVRAIAATAFRAQAMRQCSFIPHSSPVPLIGLALRPVARPRLFAVAAADQDVSPDVFKNASVRNPKGWKKIVAVTTASGMDQHGQDSTVAAVKAVRTAFEQVSLPGVVADGIDSVKAKVKVAVPYPAGVDQAAIKRIIPYHSVEVKVVGGGLRWHSGIQVPALGDTRGQDEIDADTSDDEEHEQTTPDEMQVAVAAIRVGY